MELPNNQLKNQVLNEQNVSFSSYHIDKIPDYQFFLECMNCNQSLVLQINLQDDLLHLCNLLYHS